jgi:steroid 5-alpha reductase family enzyme
MDLYPAFLNKDLLMQNAFFMATVAVMAYMIIWFIVSLAISRNDVADVAWGGGFIVAALASLMAGGYPTSRAFLVTLLVVIWGLRLALHIGIRNRGKGEDARYRKWREEWGKYFVLRSFLQIYILQGILLLLIANPIIVTITAEGGHLGIWDVLGALVWVTGFLFEAVGDYQLVQFKRDPANRGRIMQYGLWKYTRHPNYFGEVSLWWGIYLIALSVPGGWMTIIGPVTITFLILGVSGIPMLEKHYEGNKEFEEYKKSTSAFFPMLPKV